MIWIDKAGGGGNEPRKMIRMPQLNSAKATKKVGAGLKKMKLRPRNAIKQELTMEMR